MAGPWRTAVRYLAGAHRHCISATEHLRLPVPLNAIIKARILG